MKTLLFVVLTLFLCTQQTQAAGSPKEFPGSCLGLVDEVMSTFKIGTFDSPAKGVNKKKRKMSDGDLRYTFSPLPGAKPFSGKNREIFLDVLEMNGGVDIMIHAQLKSGSLLGYSMKPKGNSCEMRSVELDLLKANGNGSSGYVLMLNSFDCSKVRDRDYKLWSMIRENKSENKNDVISANLGNITTVCKKYFPKTKNTSVLGSDIEPSRGAYDNSDENSAAGTESN